MLRKFMIAAMALMLLAACAKKKIEPQSQDSKLAEEAFALIESMRASYVIKDFEGLQKLSTESGYAELRRGLRDFERVELSLSPRWVEIEGNGLTVNVSWRGTWVVNGQSRHGRGMAVFEMEGRPLKLRRIVRSSPFAAPE